MINTPDTTTPPNISPEAFWKLVEEEQPTPEELCATGSYIFSSAIVPLFCDRFRTCPRCKERRVRKWQGRVEKALNHTGPWYYAKFDNDWPHPETKIAFPVEDGVIVLSPNLDGQRVPDGDRLTELLQTWVMTPKGKRPRASHNISALWKTVKPKRTTPNYALHIQRGMGELKTIVDNLGALAIEVENDRVEYFGLDQLDFAYHLVTVEEAEVWLVEKPWDRNSPKYLLGNNGTIFELEFEPLKERWRRACEQPPLEGLGEVQ